MLVTFYFVTKYYLVTKLLVTKLRKHIIVICCDSSVGKEVVDSLPFNSLFTSCRLTAGMEQHFPLRKFH